MKLLHFIKIFLLFIYLFGSSIFFHTQAMGIQADGMMIGDCGMHHSTNTSDFPFDNGCYEKCMGIYDDLSDCSYKEKTLLNILCDIHHTHKKYDLEKNRYKEYNYLIGGENRSVYPPPFTQKYIHITKKIE